MLVRIVGCIAKARSWIERRMRLAWTRLRESAAGAAAAEYTMIVAVVAVVVLAAIALLGDKVAAKLEDVARTIERL